MTFDGYLGELALKPDFVTSTTVKGQWDGLAIGDVFVIGIEGRETRIRVRTVKYNKRRDETFIFGEDLRFVQ